MQLQLMHFATGGGAGSGLSGAHHWCCMCIRAPCLHAPSASTTEAHLLGEAMPGFSSHLLCSTCR